MCFSSETSQNWKIIDTKHYIQTDILYSYSIPSLHTSPRFTPHFSLKNLHSPISFFSLSFSSQSCKLIYPNQYLQTGTLKKIMHIENFVFFICPIFWWLFVNSNLNLWIVALDSDHRQRKIIIMASTVGKVCHDFSLRLLIPSIGS